MSEKLNQLCGVGDCDNTATRAHPVFGAWCDAHRKRRQKCREDQPAATRPLAPVKKHLRDPLQRLTEAALGYADAETDADFRRAEQRLKTAAQRFAEHATKKRQRKAAPEPRPTPMGVVLMFPRKTLLTADVPELARGA